MGIFSQKVFQGRTLCTQIIVSVLFASLLIACGDDSVSSPNEDSKNSELSSKKEEKSSSSSAAQKTSSSSVKGKVSSSSTIVIGDIPPEEGLDVIYVLVDGTVSGMIALDYYVLNAKISMVQLDTADAYKETKTVYAD